MMPLAFVDTETTGLHHDKQLYEVAIIRREYGIADAQTGGIPVKTETRYQAFVPVDLSNADLHGLNVGRFYERHPYGRYLSGREKSGISYSLSELPGLEQVQDVVENIARMTHGARFIGAAPSFDAEVLGDFLRRHGLLPTWHHRLIDTHDLAVGYLMARGEFGITDPYAWKKDDVSEMLGVKPHNDPKLVHTAMGDAQHEADIWDSIMGPGR